MSKVIISGIIIFLSCAGYVFSLGNREEKSNFNRATFSQNGSRILLDARQGTYEINLKTQGIEKINGNFDSTYSTGVEYQVGCFLSEKDRKNIKKIMGTYARGVENPRVYSGIVISQDGVEISRFETDGYCSDPYLNAQTQKVYYLKLMNSKRSFGGEGTLDYSAGTELFESNLDGSGERQLTFLKTSISEPIYSSDQAAFYFMSVDAESQMLRVRRVSIQTGEISSLSRLDGKFRRGDLGLSLDQSNRGLIVLGRPKDSDSSREEILILRVLPDGSELRLGSLKYDLDLHSEYIISSLTISPSTREIAFFLERPMTNSGDPAYRTLFLSEFDGTNFREVVVDFDKMVASFRKISRLP